MVEIIAKDVKGLNLEEGISVLHPYCSNIKKPPIRIILMREDINA
jgi:hypothetical protein